MQKVIAYQDRAEEWRRRASEATKSQERDADERMAAVWDLLARMREILRTSWKSKDRSIAHDDNSLSKALASFRSSVSNPSVNQP